MVPAGQAARFPNDAAGFKALIAWVELPVRSVTYEPTGRWHRAFEEALLKAGLPLVRVNPLQARRFTQAIGQRAKTDAVDARVRPSAYMSPRLNCAWRQPATSPTDTPCIQTELSPAALD